MTTDTDGVVEGKRGRVYTPEVLGHRIAAHQAYYSLSIHRFFIEFSGIHTTQNVEFQPAPNEAPDTEHDGRWVRIPLEPPAQFPERDPDDPPPLNAELFLGRAGNDSRLLVSWDDEPGQRESVSKFTVDTVEVVTNV